MRQLLCKRNVTKEFSYAKERSLLVRYFHQQPRRILGAILIHIKSTYTKRYFHACSGKAQVLQASNLLQVSLGQSLLYTTIKWSSVSKVACLNRRNLSWQWTHISMVSKRYCQLIIFLNFITLQGWLFMGVSDCLELESAFNLMLFYCGPLSSSLLPSRSSVKHLLWQRG